MFQNETGQPISFSLGFRNGFPFKKFRDEAKFPAAARLALNQLLELIDETALVVSGGTEESRDLRMNELHRRRAAATDHGQFVGNANALVR